MSIRKSKEPLEARSFFDRQAERHASAKLDEDRKCGDPESTLVTNDRTVISKMNCSHALLIKIYASGVKEIGGTRPFSWNAICLKAWFKHLETEFT